MKASSQRAAAAIGTGLVFNLAFSAVLSPLASSASNSLLWVLAVVSAVIALRVWSRSEDIETGAYQVRTAVQECATLGATAVLVGTYLLFPSSAAKSADSINLFYFQVLPAAVLFGLALGAATGAGLFFLARKLLARREST